MPLRPSTAFELALMRKVMANGSISGNASAYVLSRIDELTGADDS